MPVAFKTSIEMSSEQAKQFITFQIGINFIFLQFILLALVVLSSITKKGEIVAKMASHAIFQYNILVIDIDNTTLGPFSGFQVQVMTKRRQAQLGPKGRTYGGSDGGRGGAAPCGSQGSALKPLQSKGQRIEETVKKSSQNKQDRDILLSPVKPMLNKLYSPVQ